MLFENLPEGVSKLEKDLQELPFVKRVELLSGNGRHKNSISYSKTNNSYILNYGIDKKTYKFSLVVKGIKANPKYEKAIKKSLKI